MDYTSILIIIVLFALSGLNFYYLIHFWKKSNKEGKIEEKDNYYKLDAKIELQKYLALGLIAIAAFFGIAKFSDINEDLKKVDTLDSTIIYIKSDYKELDNNYIELQNKYDALLDNYNKSTSNLKSLDLKINEATARIPENHLRILAESLIHSRIEYMANIGRVFARGYSKKEIQDEITKSMESLSSFGFDEMELNRIRNNLEKDVDSLKF